MAEIDYEKLKIGDKNDEGKTVLISQSADRPNAFNSYRESKQSAADVKAMFDRPFLHVKKRVNDLIDCVSKIDKLLGETTAKQSELSQIVGQKADIQYVKESLANFKLSESEKQTIADIVLSEFANGNEVSY